MEMPSLDRNEKVACPEFGRDYTRIDMSRHPRICGVLKCSNCNFYTYSSEELTDRDHNLYRRSKTLVIMLKTERTVSNLQTHSKAERRYY